MKRAYNRDIPNRIPRKTKRQRRYGSDNFYTNRDDDPGKGGKNAKEKGR